VYVFLFVCCLSPALNPSPWEGGVFVVVCFLFFCLSPLPPRGKGPGDGGNTPKVTAGGTPALKYEIIEITPKHCGRNPRADG
jgi:hypothetical protein